MSDPERRLSELGHSLPQPNAPIATYAPYVRTGNLLHISGQVSGNADASVTGIVGDDVSLEQAQAAARICGLNLIAQMKAALDGDLSRVRRVVKLGGFVQAGPEFFDIPLVVNGCSDLMVAVFGEAGRHARAAVGVYRLPRNYAVEVDAVVEVA